MNFILGLTNLDLGFRIKGWGFGDRVSNFKKLKIKIKIFKIKRGYFGHFLSWELFCEKNLKTAIWENCPI